MRTRIQTPSQRRYRIPRYRQWMDLCLGICMENINVTIGVLDMLIDQTAQNQLSIEKMQLRMMFAIKWQTCTTIISSYSPTNINDETDRITFYNELFSLFRLILKHSVLVIGGDMNAHIGKKVWRCL